MQVRLTIGSEVSMTYGRIPLQVAGTSHLGYLHKVIIGARHLNSIYCCPKTVVPVYHVGIGSSANQCLEVVNELSSPWILFLHTWDEQGDRIPALSTSLFSGILTPWPTRNYYVTPATQFPDLFSYCYHVFGSGQAQHQHIRFLILDLSQIGQEIGRIYGGILFVDYLY